MRKSFSIGIVLLLVSSLCIVCVNASPVLNPANGHYYDIITGQNGITWSQAKIAAESQTYEGLKGHLVTITSAEENDFIVSNFGSHFAHLNYFLGGIQPPGSPEPAGGWTWVTGEPWSYTNWEPDSPGNGYGGDDGIHPQGYPEDALETYTADGRWNDFPSVVSEWGRDGYIVEWDSVENLPPVADFEATPTSGSAPLKVTFTDKSTGDGITSRVWQFKLNSESEWTTFTLDKKSSHKFINDGIYDVKLTVTGSGGSDDEVKMNYIAVMGNQPPQVFFTYSPGSPNDNQQITFDASLSQDSDGKIISYQWDFGNREIKTKKSSTIPYKYKDPGQYLVNLIVTDNEGASSSITKPVIINCPKCKIEVRAHPVPQFPLAYHLFIIYTDPQGKEFYFRGGPSKKSPVVIVTDSGKYKPKTDDWYPGAPTVTALSGWEAFNKDQCFVEELNRITSLKIPYGILGPNSNTVVSTLLDTCDVPRVKPDVDTPGWDSGNLDN